MISVIRSSARFPILITCILLFFTSACENAVSQSSEDTNGNETTAISGDGFDHLLKSCVSYNGGHVYPIQEYTLDKISTTLKDKHLTDSELGDLFKRHAYKMIGLTVTKLNHCMAWEDNSPVDDSICAEFLRCQNELTASDPLN